MHSKHPLSAGGGEIECLTKFSKRGGAWISILRGGCWERGGWLFQEGCSFYIKNKLNGGSLKNQIFRGVSQKTNRQGRIDSLHI